MSDLFNKEIEKPLLSAIIRNPALRAEIKVQASDFSPDANRVVFSAIDACIAAGGDFSKIILIERLNALGIKLGGVMSPGDYVEHLSLIQIGDSEAISLAKEIKRWTVRRELYQIGQDIINLTKEDKPDKDKKVKKASEMVEAVTQVFNRHVSIITGSHENEPVDLFATMEEYIESLGVDEAEIGPKAPYPLYYDLWGTFSPGDMSVYCARPKGAKSTFLMNTVEQCIEQDSNVICLMLDTELETKRVQRRMVSAITDINEFVIRTGQWKKNTEMRQKVREAYGRAQMLTDRLGHLYVGGKSTDEMLSICRRWHHKHSDGGRKKVLICLDYIKLSSLDLENMGSMKDYQSVGKRVDQFKQLATELQCHVLTAAQTNRSNESRDGAERRSDGSVVGLSDQISQYASNIYALERLTTEQIAQFNSIDCTHTLSCIYARNLGAQGSAPMVRYTDKGKERWKDNFLFYRIKNFRVEEIMDFRRAIERAATMGVPIQPETIPQGQML